MRQLPISRHAPFAIVISAILAAATLPAQAADSDAPLSARHEGRTTYLNGGVGQSESSYMRSLEHQWPLRLVFSERKDNEFITDVDVRVTDRSGDTKLQLDGAGPMTFLKLPPGKYRVVANFEGHKEVRNVTVGAHRGRNVYFHWQGENTSLSSNDSAGANRSS
ncbi:MAG: carboxypeptidase regulatory-like domain-containing protein [Betaproteobacteria bacterium]|nr:carboxypeptidase regulatory-like domain-containing protein [Betaproteobacteria bacterium]